ncbi:MAG: hypothetical protein OXQ86_00255 [Gammaproteobacteria bacterium]|nr:hypothetical protein [Gammaproteobacteria bacterium]MDE0415048.1 hypothetical protein [Gammaproteobacteria bacterium]
MKVLLAPLFFKQRLCKHCARLFYKKNPGSWTGIYEFESLPPLGSYDPDRGFVPDLPSLLMFDEFVLDGEAYERIRNPGHRPWLREWSKLLEALDSEGAITVEDVQAAASTHPHTRGWMLRRDMQDPTRWSQAMGYFDALVGDAQRLLGEDPCTAQEYSWRFDPEAQYGVRGIDGHMHDLSVILGHGADPDYEAHAKLFSQAVSNAASQLREVNACLNACNVLGVAPMMWAPYRRYLQEKLASTGAKDQSEAGRDFFELAFPAYAPTSIDEFSKLRVDRRIGTLRSEIRRAAEHGDLIDPRYPQRVLDEVLRLERKGAKVRRIAGWVASAVGSIPVPGLGIAATAASEAVNSALNRKRTRPWRWFYLISDGRGAT